MRLFDYARAATSHQSLENQIKELRTEGVNSHRIFSDKVNGRDLGRPGLGLLQLKAEKGDVILVRNFGRLGRDTADMIQLIKDFDENATVIRFLDDGISTESTMGKIVITILPAVAQAVENRVVHRS